MSPSSTQRSSKIESIIERRVTTPDGGYTVYLGAHLQTGDFFSTLFHGENFSPRCALITNPQIGPLYAPRILDALRAAGFEPTVIEVPEGERYKTLETVGTLYDRLIAAHLDRGSPVLALGGGVVSDMAGFAAATFLRGVPFVVLPTTLLAMVDASIGGKVAVDHPAGKNLIGAFKQPFAVVADTETLKTLPDAEWRSGMAEAVKHAIIGAPELFEQLGSASKSNVREWIGRAVQVKTDMVTRDPYEQGERAKLNLGHTFGHALEKLSDYQMRHGDAVAIGLVCAARLAEQLGMASPDLELQITELLCAIGLPVRIPGEISTDAMLDAMLTDKKRINGRLRFILPRELGDVVIVDEIAREEVASVMDGLK